MAHQSAAAGPSRRSGAWEPLPHIYSGLVVHPFRPSSSPPSSPTASHTHRSHKQRSSFAASASSSSRADDLFSPARGNPHEVSLDVGDEFFAFEEYRCEEGDVWFRGYVVQGVSLSMLMPSSDAPTVYPKVEPSVLIGIFPAAVVHVRPNAGTESDVLAAAHERARELAEERAREMRYEMAAVREEDEDDHHDGLHPNGDVFGDIDGTPKKRKGSANGGGMGLLRRSHRPASLVLTPPRQKEQPPLPTLTAGDSTVAGQQWPLVDEIACAIREWYSRLPTYLAMREYRLFNAVVQHIDALFLGRRQLFSQMLSGEELVRIRRECVSRLVKCNVAQGLEVIVRSFEDGSVVGMDKDRALTSSGWMGGVLAYIYQVQLAYIDLVPLDALFGKSTVPRPLKFKGQALTPLSPVSPVSPTDPSRMGEENSSLPSGYHLLLDFRAFVASPCSPGETAELFFSLYSKAQGKFLTEEFCLILNHNGSPARDAERRLGKLRTLFADLRVDDVAPGTYLVCRIVRNGSMKMSAESSTVGSPDNHRSARNKRNSGVFLQEAGSKWRSSISISDNATDDSVSMASGYEPPKRTPTIDTTMSYGTGVGGRASLRRPLGCAVFELPSITRLTGEASGEDLVMPIYVARDEANFATLHADIILHNERAYDRSTRAEAMAFGLKLFHGPLDQVIRNNPSMLLETPQTLRLGFPDVVPPGAVRNDLYIKLWAASFSTMFPAGGALRVRKTVAPIPANTQVSLEVRRADGSLVADSLYAGGSGEPPLAQYNSIVYYHNDKPTFGELIKIALPQGSGDCHLFLSFRHRTRDRDSVHEGERPFAFAYLPLFSHNASIKDGKHELILYHMEKSSMQPTPNLYFEVPSTGEPRLTAEAARHMTALRDRISLRTFLCSTLHTQDDTLRALFAWQSADTETLCRTLQLFGFVGEDEIAKFLQPVLDSLFAILVSHLGDRREEVDDLVFKGLIKVLSMASDRRFPSFGPILASYTAKHFAFQSVASHLLRAMKGVMGRPATQEYRSLLKVWHNVFRFVIRSRELDRSRGPSLGPTSSQIEADFKRQTRDILSEINNIMLSSDKALIGSQTLAVQHYADILPDLAQVFPPSEIAEMVIVFTDTLTRAQGNLAIYKLLLILQIVKTLLEFNDTRAELIPAIIRWLKPHIGGYEEDLFSARNETQANKDSRKLKWLECNRLAISVLAWTVNKLQELLDSPIIKSDPLLLSQEEDNIEYCLSIFPLLLESYNELADDSILALLERHRSSPTVWKSTPDVFPSSHPFALVSHLPPPALLGQAEDEVPPAGIFRCGLAEVAVVIFTLVIATPKANMIRYLEEVLDMGGTEEVTKLLKTSFGVFSSIIRFDAYPRQWLTLSGLGFIATARFLEPVISFLQRSEFVPPIEDMERFDLELWTRCIELLCDMCSSPELALEDQGLQRRRAAWIIVGDLRDEGSVLLKRLWNAIGWDSVSLRKDTPRYGGYQTRFTGLAERILTLCLSSHERLCEAAVDVLFSMIYAEYVLDGKFNAIQTEIFQKLEVLFTQKTVTASESATRAYFVTRLRHVFETTPEIDANFRTRVAPFLDEVELFIDLLMAVRDLPETPMWKEERVAATVRLMHFFSKVGRDDLYVRFVHHVVAINAAAQDWLGAGLALKLHSDLYNWTFEGELVDEFENGDIKLPAQSQFERKEALLYHVLEYFAEAEAYEHAADICQDIVAQHRRITFDIGRISELLTHEARLWERIGLSTRPKPEYFRVAYFGNFTSLDLDKEFIVRGTPWQRYVDFCETLQTKHPDAQIHRSKIPPSDSVRYGTEPVIWVTSVTPLPNKKRAMFRKGVNQHVQAYYKANSVDRFETMRPYILDPEERDSVLHWIEKTTIITSNELPALESRAEIVHIHHDHISPVDSAIVVVRNADRDLRKLVDATPVDVKLLGTALNGAVDSKVNGGIPLYKKHFFDAAYVERHPTEAKNVAMLRQAILEYARTIQKGLIAHRRVNKDIAFQEALRTLFTKVYPEEIAQLPPMPEANDYGPQSPGPLSPAQSRTSFSKNNSPALAQSSTMTSSPVLSDLPDSQRNSYHLPALRVGPRASIPTVAGVADAPGRPSISISNYSHSHSHSRSHSAQSSPRLPQGPASMDSHGHGQVPRAGGILLTAPLNRTTSSSLSRKSSKRTNGHAGSNMGHSPHKSEEAHTPSTARPSGAYGRSGSVSNTASRQSISESERTSTGTGSITGHGDAAEHGSPAMTSAAAVPSLTSTGGTRHGSVSTQGSSVSMPTLAESVAKTEYSTSLSGIPPSRQGLRRFGSLLRR